MAVVETRVSVWEALAGRAPGQPTGPADPGLWEAVVERLNTDPRIHGCLVQLPLPKHINAERVLNAINPLKDVDGFHPVNVGKV